MLKPAANLIQKTGIGKKLIQSRFFGIKSKLFGHSAVTPTKTAGLLNKPGSMLKIGWSSTREYGGSYVFRAGIGRGIINPNTSRVHVDFIQIPNDVYNSL